MKVHDILEIISSYPKENTPIRNNTGDDVQFSTSGLEIDGSNSDNLCIKAYYLLEKDFPALPAVAMHLHKVIPMGAGLGGGSADGAFVLESLNSVCKLGLSDDQLIVYAAQLGSDCAFFLLNKPCFASGRGEIMEALQLDLSGYAFVLVNTGLRINTGWAFSQLTNVSKDIAQGSISLKDIITNPIQTWKNMLINDFEAPVFEQYPTIRLIKETLYDKGALYASMTGSGSTVYGIFHKENLPDLKFPDDYLVMQVPA